MNMNINFEIYYSEVAKNTLLRWKLSTMVGEKFVIYYSEVTRNALLRWKLSTMIGKKMKFIILK